MRTLRGLYAITPQPARRSAPLEDLVFQVIEGGARLVQYRNKTRDVARRRSEAAALARLCHRHGIALVVNDDVALANRVGADGVHLGVEDASVEHAREVLGPKAIVGVSCHDSVTRAIDAVHRGASYVAFGRFFSSKTKPDAMPASLDVLRRARTRLEVPIAAIGGITPENAGILVAEGADLIAVVDGVFASADPIAAARRIACLFEEQ